jgi:uncharacterized alpha-E superfamily protein
MLSRVASHLYWMSRSQERAENMARILDVGQSLALLSRGRADDDAFLEPLHITGTLVPFDASGRGRTPEAVARFLAWDLELQSSIYNSIRNSRENARAVRAALTTEMWENINDTWLQMQQKRRQENEPIDNAFFEWVKERGHLFRGVTVGTIRREQPYQFILLGTFVERADNTARILSVKKQSDRGDGEAFDSITDFYRQSALLRSVSAFEAYRDTYRDAVDRKRVAELLVLNPQMPRSLRFCFDQVVRLLSRLPIDNARPARQLAATMHAQLEFAVIDEILEEGLHGYLERFVDQTIQLGELIREAYLELE